MAASHVVSINREAAGDASLDAPSDDAPAIAFRPRADRANRMARHLRRAVELSYPLYTFAELKRVLRCEYHTMVSELRSQSSKTWGELTLLTGMTRAGLNKLGDEVPPRPAHSGIRLLLILLQESGPQGLPLPRLAARYYERCPELDDGPSFEEALRALIDTGEVADVEGRFVCAAHTFSSSTAVADDIEVTVGRIADTVRAEAGRGVAQLHRVTLRVPADPDAQRKVLRAIKDAVCQVAMDAEGQDLGEDTELLTVVVGGGNILL